MTPINFMTSFAKFVKLMQSTNSDCNFKCNLKVILAAVGDQSKAIWPISSEYAAKRIFDQMAANPYHGQPYGLLRVAEEGAAPRGHEPTPTPKIALALWSRERQRVLHNLIELVDGEWVAQCEDEERRYVSFDDLLNCFRITLIKP